MAKKEFTVLVVEPNELPIEKKIPNTLEAQQEIVGGYIECMDIHRKGDRVISIVLNEEGKLIDLEPNRLMAIVGRDGNVYTDMLVGTIFIQAYDMSDGSSVGLTKKEVEEYTEIFSRKSILIKV